MLKWCRGLVIGLSKISSCFFFQPRTKMRRKITELRNHCYIFGLTKVSTPKPEGKLHHARSAINPTTITMIPFNFISTFLEVTVKDRYATNLTRHFHRGHLLCKAVSHPSLSDLVIILYELTKDIIIVINSVKII